MPRTEPVGNAQCRIASCVVSYAGAIAARRARADCVHRARGFA